MKKLILGLALAILSASSFSAMVSEIKVDLRLSGSDFVAGERIRAVVDIANSSPDTISVGYPNSKDSFFLEVFRAGDMTRMTRTSRHPYVAAFQLQSSEGQKLETFIGDHFALRETRRYLVKPVLVHNGVRYEGSPRAFDVVDGVKISGAMQMFANRAGLFRNFKLVYWSRNHSEHLFLCAEDSGNSKRKWVTTDLGPILRIDKPTISILKSGEVIVLHRLNQDQFVRSEFWSLPDAIEFRKREAVSDPETAGTARVRELYKESNVKPKINPWWKFW